MDHSFADDPIILKGRYSKVDVEGDARKAARIIRSVLTGPVDSPRAWADAAEALGCKVIPGRSGDGAPGHYYGHCNTMVYDPRHPAAMVCRFFAHELTHHVLVTWPGSVYRKGWERWDDDRNTVQHRVATLAETMLIEGLE